MLNNSRIFSYLTAAAPGLDELVTLGKIWELAQMERRNKRDSPFETCVVDAPATGHGVAMLRSPRTYADIAKVGPVAKHAGLLRPAHPRRALDRGDRRRAGRGDAGERDHRAGAPARPRSAWSWPR